MSVKKVSSEENITELQTMPAVDTTAFKNIFVVDEVVSKEKKLPITRWAMEYPDGLEVKFPDNRRDYITLNHLEGEEIIEALSISHTPRLRLQKESKVKGFLEEVSNGMKRTSPSFELKTIEKKRFQGKIMWVLQGTVDFSEYKAHGYNGIYHLMVIVPLPEKNRIIYAVSAMFLANEKSRIKTFEDFQDKGMMSEVWSTFRYVE